MFNLFKKTPTPKLVITTSTSDPEEDRRKAMLAEQEAIQRELGIDSWDVTQSWLRLHQLLKSHEDRIAELEKKA
jgi:hypothetical protein